MISCGMQKQRLISWKIVRIYRLLTRNGGLDIVEEDCMKMSGKTGGWIFP